MDRQDLERELVELAKHGDRAALKELFEKCKPKLVGSLREYFKKELRGDDDTLNDVVQITHLKAWRALRSFRGESSFFTWLYPIAINAACGYFDWRDRNKPIYWDPSTHKGYDTRAEHRAQYLEKARKRGVAVPDFWREGRRAPTTNDPENIPLEGQPSPRTGRPTTISFDQLARVERDSEDAEGFEDSLENTLESEERVILRKAALDAGVRRLPTNQRQAIMLQREGRTYEEIAGTMNLTVSAVWSLMSRARETLKASLTTDIQRPRSSLGELFGEAMRRQQNGRLISPLYKMYKSPK